MVIKKIVRETITAPEKVCSHQNGAIPSRRQSSKLVSMQEASIFEDFLSLQLLDAAGDALWSMFLADRNGRPDRYATEIISVCMIILSFQNWQYPFLISVPRKLSFIRQTGLP
jgi:hypothetical protein